VIDKPQLIVSEPARDGLQSAEASVSVDGLHTVRTTLIGIYKAPDNGKGTVWEADAGVDRVCVEVLTQLVKKRRGTFIHTSSVEVRP
jgi:hypothetical protein